MCDTHEHVLNLLNLFSLRATRVLFAARLKAGQRGTSMIELGDLLLGIVLEDRDMIDSLPSDMDMKRIPALSFSSRSPFISSEAAGALIMRIEMSLPKCDPISQTEDMPLSREVQAIFDRAKDLQSWFHHSHVEPLHLLAGVLMQELDQYVELLQELGITKDLVLQSLRKEESTR